MKNTVRVNKSMSRAISPFIALLASIWLINLGGGLQGTLLGLRAEMESFELTSTGFILSSYFLGYIVSFLLFPLLLTVLGISGLLQLLRLFLLRRRCCMRSLLILMSGFVCAS